MISSRSLRSPRPRSLAAALAGPAVIVVGVLVVMNGFALRGLMSQGDILRFWLPTYCHLGKSLAAGHIPAWDPYVMGGAPFAADPQSGWMYLPVMALFSTLPCGAAIRFMVVLQPILGGLGMLWFLRAEGFSRPAATTGGVVLALSIASGELATSLPFAGSLAWTAVLLAGVARYQAATTWPRRLLWGALAAGAWGQLAAAHFSVGFVFGTGGLLAYLAVTGWRGWTRGRWAGVGETTGRVGLLALLGVSLNLAYLLPRLGYLPTTDLSLGYFQLVALGARLAGAAPHLVPGPAVGPAWPLKLATFPGVYVGAAALLLSFAAFWNRRARPLAIGFAAYGLVGYGLSLGGVSNRVPHSMWNWRPVDLYLHSPEWFGYVLLPALAILAAAGLEAWAQPRPLRHRLAMLAPGALVWLVLPLLLGAGVRRSAVALIGAVAGLGALALVARRPTLALVIPALLAVEMTASGTAGNVSELPFEPVPTLLQALANPNLRASSFLQAGPIVRAIQAGPPARYMKLPRPGKGEPLPSPSVTGMLTNHSLLFGIEDTGTFDPVQPLRSWVFVRASQRLDVKYNRSYFVDPPPIALDLLQVGWLVAPQVRPAEPGTTAVTQQGTPEPWVLYARGAFPHRVEAVTSWRVVQGASGKAYPNAALDAILAPSFDPAAQVILERDPGLGPGPGGASTPAPAVSFVERGDQELDVTVDAPAPVVLLVRTVYDPHWRAEVDGHPATVLRADYFLQAVAVPAGRHTVVLRYHDPRIGLGLLGSVLALAVVIGAALATRARPGGARPDGPAPSLGSTP